MMSVQKQEKNLDFIFKSILAGGIAGMCSKTAVAPLDRIKILLQAHNSHYRHLGVFSGIQEVTRKESLLALYKGNGAQMVRVFPYAATQFTAFEIYSQMFRNTLGTQSHIGKLLAGSCAGATAVTFTYPLDTIRARLAFQVTETYTGIVHTAVSIFQQEGGLRGLYRGFLPTLCGMIPYAGFSFYCFEMLKLFCMKYIPGITCTPSSRNTGGLALSISAKLMCGGFAGAIAQSIAYPMDVTRRRMQLAMMMPETHKFGVTEGAQIILICRSGTKDGYCQLVETFRGSNLEMSDDANLEDGSHRRTETLTTQKKEGHCLLNDVVYRKWRPPLKLTKLFFCDKRHYLRSTCAARDLVC